MKKILAIFLTLLLCLNITGCSSSNPKDTVNSYLNSLKKGNVEECAKYLKGNSNEDPSNNLAGEDEISDKTFKTAYSKLKYKILDSKIDGDKATVETEINAPDLAKIMTEMLKEIIPLALASAFNEENSDDSSNDEKMNELINTKLSDKLNSNDIPMVKKNIKINLIKEKDEWLIKPDKDFYNAITGNLATIGELFEE